MTNDSRLKLSLLGAVLLAAAVRAPALVAGWPYSHYVDEGHVMLIVMKLVRDGGWDPGWYIYPSLPLYAIALPARLLAPLYGWLRGEPLADAVSPLVHYELLDPPELLLFGRVLTLAAGLAIVVLAGLLARRLAGDLAGGLAALAAALAPALVIRGGIVIVDTWAALFILACLLLTDRLVTSPRPTAGAAALAGAMGGLALASKYTGGLVGIAFGVTVLLAPFAWRRKLLLLAAGGAGAVLAAVAAMPALVLRPEGVRAAWQWLETWYGGPQVSVRFWPQAVRYAEWDQPLAAPELGWPFLLLTAAGLAVALADRRLARRVAGWVIYGAIFVGLAARFPFQPFRNLLPLVAPAAVLAALALVRLVERLPGPRRIWRAAAALALVFLLGRPALQYARGRWQTRDSRTEALAWLAPRLEPGDRVLVSEELAILPSELRRLPGRVRSVPWPGVREALRSGRYRFYLGGALRLDGRRPLPPRARERVARRYEVRAVFGEDLTYAHTGLFSGNRRRVDVWEVRPSGRQGASGLRRDAGRVR
jgi:4-amino-4-deoxy-L-arabinose transferase-like glycosyltransferase